MTHPKWLSTDLWEAVGEGMASAKQEVLLISPYVSSATIAAILADVDEVLSPQISPAVPRISKAY